MKFKEAVKAIGAAVGKTVFSGKTVKMAVLVSISAKILAGCSQGDVESLSEEVSNYTGLNVQNLTTVTQGVVNGAQKLDQGITNTVNTGLSVAATIAEHADAHKEDAPALPAEFQGEGNLSVHFIDVGQGDSILLEYEEDGNCAYALIDTGDNDKGTTVQKYLMDQGVDKLDYLILTHNHADHIGGADVIINKFDIDHVYMSSDPVDSKTYRDVMDALNYRSYKAEIPEAGQSMMLGAAELSVLAAPNGNENLNNDSIVVKASYGESSFLFMGDAEFEEEEELLDQFADLDSTLDVDVLKAGHHGSYTSSSNEFIAEVTPQWTVVCCGMGNSYGHPHNTSLYNFADYESGLYRTDIQGSIVCTTNGSEYVWDHEVTENWKSGEELTEDDYEYDDYER